ncbi:uncharacterized protein FIBRA_08037 [Fibroporia radiculosa]|uniref:Uncharacterized protein n=1 Tax=Fibroporia radiculosa TaxID=599839 RepID=J4GG98_9APHY|nr:uncharacterized protein FIBRA_08037 [Fibroporia radiculosa]CCM05803.1 predicted protein [Fibroporia radiculosa]
MATTVSAVATTQKFTLPYIPELFNPNFLDILLPAALQVAPEKSVDAPKPHNAMMNALNSTAHRTLTENNAPTYDSTLDPTLDAFQGLTSWSDYEYMSALLTKSWEVDPLLTLRLIWQLRSIHEGKGEKEAFYRYVHFPIRCLMHLTYSQRFGWLYKHHPRTAISNLSMLVVPVCPHKKKRELSFAHGYWKDLLNILALATTDELESSNATFLHYPRQPFCHRNERGKKAGGNEQVDEMKAKAKRVRMAEERHEILVKRLKDPKYRALFIAVARLFSAQLIADMNVMWESIHLTPEADRIALYKKISLAGKWSPSPGASHDRHTNIATAVAILLHHSCGLVKQPFPSSLASFDAAHTAANVEQALVLRSYYQRWIISRLREITLVPEPLMSANKWSSIRYNRVASVCMKNNTAQFYRRDAERFEQYLMDVESGKKTISGATLLPHEILKTIVNLSNDIRRADTKSRELQKFRKSLAEMQIRTLEAQWNALVARVKGFGSLDNALAICDVSESMMSLDMCFTRGKEPPRPLYPAIALSILLARVANPPFRDGFITFSQAPQFVKLDPALSLKDTMGLMKSSAWGMNTDFNAVFLKLLLPLAVKNKVPKEDMIKRLFVFSDMQFDDARRHDLNSDESDWKTNHDHIVEAYAEAGYDIPQIVYWNLAHHATTDVTAEREGVALVNGFSPSMLKMFMGEEKGGEEEEEAGWELVEVFNPLNVMRKAVMRPAYDGLVVVD